MTKKQLRVGLTAMGGDMAASTVLSLRKNKQVSFYVHAFNSEHSNVMAAIADDFSVLPKGDDPNYVSELIAHIEKSHLDVLMPWSDEEAIALSGSREIFFEKGCTVLVSPSSVMNDLLDKAMIYDKLKKAGIRVPEHIVVSDLADIYKGMRFFGYPKRTVVVKPSTGRGGRGVKIYVGDDLPPDWLGVGLRERRIQTFNPNELDFDPGQSYLMMPCLHAPVYDADIFRFQNVPTKCFVRQRNNRMVFLTMEV